MTRVSFDRLSLDDRLALLQRIASIDLRAQAGRPWPVDATRRAAYLQELAEDSRLRSASRIANRR